MTTPRVPPAPPAPSPPAVSSFSTHDAGMLLVCLIWGINFGVMKLAIGQMPPLAFTAVRFVLASLLLWVVLRLTEGPLALPSATLRRLVVLGVVGNTIYQLTFILGLAHTTATNSSLLLSTMPTVVAVLAGALGLERVTARMGWGIALGTLGVALVIAARGVGFSVGTMTGDLLTVLAVLCWAGYTLGLRALPSGISSLRVTTVTTIAGAPGLVLAGLPGMIGLDWWAVPATAWMAMGYATLFSLVLAYILWNRSVKAVGGTRTAVYMCVTPLVAATAAWVLLGERVHPLQGFGAVLIIAGVLLTRKREGVQGTTHDASSTISR